jgi:TonB family protein
MIKASLLLALVYCLMFFMRRRPSAERHMIWVLAIHCAALLPLLTIALPAWQPQVVASAVASLPRLLKASGLSQTGGSVNVQALGIEPGVSLLMELLRVVWLLGALATLFFLIRGYGRLKRVSRRARSLVGSEWNEMVVELSTALGMSRAVELRVGDGSAMPMTWGFVRPNLLLPDSSKEWTSQRRRMVLAHELAHIRRADWLFQLLAELACVVYWFNPLFWVARNRLDFESERACDDTVLNLGFEGPDYATHLLEIARAMKKKTPAWLPALAMAKKFSLETRLIAILNRTADRRGPSAKRCAVVAAAAIGVSLVIASVQAPVAAEPVANAQAPEVVEYTTPPLYSDEGRSRGIEGSVLVSVRVGVDGHLSDLRVVRGLGFGLDENALLAVREWKFRPALRNGKPLDMAAEVSVEFSLRNAELNESIANDMATRVGPGIVPPRIIHRVDPDGVPHREGTVILDAVIQEDGTPKIVRVVRSLSWDLDERAIGALKHWRFSPAVKDGVPVKVRMNVEMSFDPN